MTFCEADHPEDAFVIRHIGPDSVIAAVIDGVSGFHSPNCPNRIFQNRQGGKSTGGQVVARIIQDTINTAPMNWTLDRIMKDANNRIAKWARKNNISLDEPDNLPGAHVAAVKISNGRIELVQTGDCLAFAGLSSELRLATNNTEWVFGQQEIPRQIELLKQCDGNRGEMWNRIEGDFRRWRRELTNIKYPTFNGQKNCASLWFTKILDQHEFNAILLVTDGLVPEEMLHQTEMTEAGTKILQCYQRGCWLEVFGFKGEEAISEGTGVAIHFKI